MPLRSYCVCGCSSFIVAGRQTSSVRAAVFSSFPAARPRNAIQNRQDPAPLNDVSQGRHMRHARCSAQSAPEGRTIHAAPIDDAPLGRVKTVTATKGRGLVTKNNLTTLTGVSMRQ